MGKKTYDVLVPIAGAIHVRVEAKSRIEAENAAMDIAGEFLSNNITVEDSELTDLESLEVYEHIVEGNVCHIPTSVIEVTEAGDG